jgi:flagellin
MRIQTNIASLNAIESGIINGNKLSSSLEKLGSGLRVNKASDDASGLAIADKLRTQVSSIAQSITNANSAVAMIQIADRAMGEQSNILDIVKQKLIQAATATTSSEGTNAIAKDIHKLLTQLDNIASQTNYNGVKLLEDDSGNATVSLDFLIGETQADKIRTSGNIQANINGLDNLAAIKSVVSLGKITATEAKTAMGIIDKAIGDLNGFRSDFGSTQNQIESATRNLMTQKTNIAAAESVIRDVDYANESANFSKYNIMSTSSVYAQAQANTRPNDVLKLLV